MTNPLTYPENPVELPMPRADPDPVPGCEVCSALVEERAEARSAGNGSKVTDLNIELRNHAGHRGRSRRG
nr:hypothetical protein [Streptomyces sp. NA04227]